MRYIHVYTSPHEVAEHVAEWFVEAAQQSIAVRQRFSVAFAGGSTPRLLYEYLAEQHRDTVEWEKVFGFWGDERFVPLDHPDSNYRMVRETLLEQVPIPTQNVYPMVTNHHPMEAAAQYEQTLRAFFGTHPSYTFDLLLLGMGDDGHTASLFPYTVAVEEREKWVVAQNVDKAKGWRLTLTPPFINLARQIVVMVTGKTKAARLQEVLTGEYDPQRLPIQSIMPVNGDITWAVDRAASTSTTV